jgi:hypothetical protein
MKFFQVERNEDCPCGSGRKFKKCCQGQVEEMTRRISQAVGPGCTAAGREVIEVLGFLSGLQVEEGQMPAPETLGKILAESWDEEAHAALEDNAALNRLSVQFQMLLSEKPLLRNLRIPVWLFDYPDDDDFDIIEYFNHQQFIFEALELMRTSLLYDDYTEDELKVLLTGLGWLVGDNSREIFLRSVLFKTRSELAAVSKEMEGVFENNGGEQNGEAYQMLRNIFDQYPAYEKMLADAIYEDAAFAVEAVIQGDVELKVPLYSVLGGIYALISELVDRFSELLDSEARSLLVLPSLEEALIDGDEYIFFLVGLVASIVENIKDNQGSELGDSLGKLLLYITCLNEDSQIALITFLYMRSACSFLSGLPLVVQEAGVEFGAPRDFCDEDLIERYAGYLESQGQQEEAAHVREIYRSMGEQVREQAAAQEQELIEFSQMLLGKV